MHHTVRRLGLVASAALLLAAAAGAAGAGAAPRPATVSPSSTWSGYGEQSDTHLLATSVTLPSFTCFAGDTASQSVIVETSGPGGLGGVAYLVMVCTDGTPSYRGTILIGNSLERFFPGTLSPGDVVDDTINTNDTTGLVKVTIKDVTTATSYAQQADAGTGTDSNGWVLFAAAPPVFPFTKLVFNGLKVDGAPFGSTSPNGYQLVNASNSTLVATSGFLPSGLGFHDTFVKSS